MQSLFEYLVNWKQWFIGYQRGQDKTKLSDVYLLMDLEDWFRMQHSLLMIPMLLIVYLWEKYCHIDTLDNMNSLEKISMVQIHFENLFSRFNNSNECHKMDV